MFARLWVEAFSFSDVLRSVDFPKRNPVGDLAGRLDSYE